MKKIFYACLLSALLSIPPAWSRDVSGFDIPEQITLPGNSKLILNGVGIRSKFFFKIYVGALYLPDRQTTSGAILEHSGPKRVSMFILYDEISTQKLADGWREGFENNLSSEEYAKLKQQLETFSALFPTVRQQDVIHLDYLPGTGTQVIINSKLRGTITGEDFNRALLKVWLGDEPADEELKEAMLGSN